MKTITIKEAVDQKLNSLTREFKLPKEKWMMDNIIKDLKRGNIKYAIVQFPDGPEIWRSGFRYSNQHESSIKNKRVNTYKKYEKRAHR